MRTRCWSVAVPRVDPAFAKVSGSFRELTSPRPNFAVYFHPIRSRHRREQTTMPLPLGGLRCWFTKLRAHQRLRSRTVNVSEHVPRIIHD